MNKSCVVSLLHSNCVHNSKNRFLMWLRWIQNCKKPQNVQKHYQDIPNDVGRSYLVGSAQYGCNSIFQKFSGETKNFAVFYLKIAMY